MPGGRGTTEAASIMSVTNPQERLKTHSSAFDGLLSLIPAKYYYDDATQDQWQLKKQLKKDAQLNKRAKLDPDAKHSADDYNNHGASAKDVMNNRAKTAKKVELPGAKAPQPIIENDSEDVDIPDMDVDTNDSDNDDNSNDSGDFIRANGTLVFDDEGNEVADKEAAESATRESKRVKRGTKKELSAEEQQQKSKNLAKLKAQLSEKITLLREKRKAPGSKTGGAVKSRDQILADRKRKEEARRQEKLKRKLEEVDENLESESESEAEEEDENKAVLFGNIVFNDGSRVTSDLSKMRKTAEKRKEKGPANNDIKAHLLKLEQKKQKLAQMSPEDQAKQQDKDQWQRVMSQAEGIKVKDNEKLLKKALKQKERQKLKSEIEWKDRKQVVKDTVAARAKRREENLKARRDNKGKKGKNQVRLKKFTGTVNKKAMTAAKGLKGKKRAGFEGSAKSNKKK